ncbi:MAG: alpha/beta hydrolase [Bacteroidales bacterium]|nr:alpha/beta hydrolase [Bacteroidales bacterium]
MTSWTDPATQQIVNYAERGRGTPVVLLHAFPQSHEMWIPQITALSDQYRIIAPDLPGFGGSSLPQEGWTVESAADRIADFLSGIGLTEPVVLGGLSMGGYVALAFARRHPDRLRGLILADTRAEADSPEAHANREAAITLAEAQGTAAVFAGMRPHALGATTHQHRPAVVAEATRIAQAQPAPAVVAAIRALRDRPDASSCLPGLTIPALVIVGDEDTLTPPDVARGLADRLPMAQLVVLPGAGHLSNLETPELFNAAIRSFLERNGA